MGIPPSCCIIISNMYCFIVQDIWRTAKKVWKTVKTDGVALLYGGMNWQKIRGPALLVNITGDQDELLICMKHLKALRILERVSMDKSQKPSNQIARQELLRQAHKLLQPDKSDGEERAVFRSKWQLVSEGAKFFRLLDEVEQIFVTDRRKPCAVIRKISKAQASTYMTKGIESFNIAF